jgi:hypothetical protein
MSDIKWKNENMNIIQEMWSNRCLGRGLCAICNKCGGSSISKCKCAKKKFFDTITYEEVMKFISLQSKDHHDDENKKSVIEDVKNISFKEVIMLGKRYLHPNTQYGVDINIICDKCKNEIKISSLGHCGVDLCAK